MKSLFVLALTAVTFPFAASAYSGPDMSLLSDAKVKQVIDQTIEDGFVSSVKLSIDSLTNVHTLELEWTWKRNSGVDCYKITNDKKDGVTIKEDASCSKSEF